MPESSRRPSSRAPVPLIISSFPVPPSHIPPTPTSASNPPPTGPPSAPLPPLPSGPSRISEHDQLFLLSSIASRGWRSSKYSQRDSIINGPPSRDSVVSSRSHSTSLSISRSTPPTSPFQQQLTRSPSPILSTRRHQPNESISSIDMSDVLDVCKDDFNSSPTPPSRPSRTRQSQIVNFNPPPDTIDPEMLLELQDSIITSQPTTSQIKPLSPTSPSTPSRRSPVTANYYSHMPLSESYRLAHARSSSTVTTVVGAAAGSPQSQTQTPMQNHTRSLSNSSTAVPHLDSFSRGGLGLDLGLDLSAPPTYTSEGAPSSTTPANTHSKMTDSYSTTTQFSSISPSSSFKSVSSSPLPSTIRDVHLEMKTHRSTSQDHKKLSVGQSGSGGYPGQGEDDGRSRRETGGDRKDKRETTDLHQHSLSQLSLGGITTSSATNTTTITSNKTTRTEGQGHGRETESDEMTLDEFGTPAAISTALDYSKKQNYPDHQDLDTSTQSPRVPSPDIATILSVMSRPALSLSRSRSGADSKARSKHRSKSTAPPGKRRVVSVSTTNTLADPKYHSVSINRNRRQSEGAPTLKTTTAIPAHGKAPSSELAYLHKHSDSIVTTNGLPPSTTLSNNGGRKTSLSQSISSATTELSRISGGSYYEQEADDGGYYDEALERVLEGRGSEDEEDAAAGVAWENAARDKRRERPSRRAENETVVGEGGGGGDDSDSSLDLHTPLPHLMLRHGLLSPNSKLLPQAEGSRAATPLDGRPESMMSLVSNGSVMTKSGIIKDERDTLTRRVRHRDGKLLRGGIGLTTGLGWSDSEDEDAPSPLTRRLSTLDLSRRSSASSIRSANLPPIPSPSLSTSVSSSSLRRLHPLSRSYSSGAVLETELENKSFGSYDSYSYTYDGEEEEEGEEEDHTLEESGHWAQRHRLGVSTSNTSSSSSPPVSWQRHQPPPTSRSRNRRNHQTTHQGALGARASTGSVGSAFSLEVTIPESGNNERERSKTPSRLRRPSSHASIKSTTVGAGGRDSSGSSSFDNRSSGLSSNISLYHRRSGGGDDNGNTPSSTGSTPSISMPATPKDIFDPAAPPLLSSMKGMLVNKDKSLPPLPTGGLKKKASGGLQRSVTSNGTTASAAAAMSGTGKYAFPSTRARAPSSTSAASISIPSPPSNVTSFITPATADIGSSSMSASSSAATIKPHVRPFQLPRHSTTSRTIGDRPAVPVPSPSIPNSAPITATPDMNALRAPISSFSMKRPSPITPILLGHAGTASAPCSPTARPLSNPNLDNNNTTTGISRPKPRTGTGMVYRTSSYGAGVNSKMRAPMMLSASSSVVSSVSVSSGGGGGVGNGSNGVPRAIAL